MYSSDEMRRILGAALERRRPRIPVWILIVIDLGLIVAIAVMAARELAR